MPQPLKSQKHLITVHVHPNRTFEVKICAVVSFETIFLDLEKEVEEYQVRVVLSCFENYGAGSNGRGIDTIRITKENS